MTEHLSVNTLNLFADGELTPEQLSVANEHLVACQACTARALSQMVLKATTARAGQRYAMPEGLRERVLNRVLGEAAAVETAESAEAKPATKRRSGPLGWAAAAALLIAIALGNALMERSAGKRMEEAALVTEACDQHIGVLAANQEPQVVSSDRHTVKPWFQGKLPYSFNLPDKLAEDTKLDGANLTYLHGQPVAQLLYSIGKHRVSVFVRERGDSGAANERTREHSGFQIVTHSSGELELVAVSDVSQDRLRDLVDTIAQAQTK